MCGQVRDESCRTWSGVVVDAFSEVWVVSIQCLFPLSSNCVNNSSSPATCQFRLLSKYNLLELCELFDVYFNGFEMFRIVF